VIVQAAGHVAGEFRVPRTKPLDRTPECHSGAGSSRLWGRGRVFDGGGGGIEAGSAVVSAAGRTADQRAAETGGWRGGCNVVVAAVALGRAGER
jgi:hypothetical protein